MRRQSKNIIICIICVFLLTGCWNYKDVDRRNISVCTSVDYKDQNYIFALEIAKVRGNKGDSRQEDNLDNDVVRIFSKGKTLTAIICREIVEEFFKTKPKNDVSIGFNIEDMLNNLTNKGLTYTINVGKINNIDAIGKQGYLLNHVGVAEEEIKFFISIISNIYLSYD